MNKDITRPFDLNQPPDDSGSGDIFYRCTCGQQLKLDPATGGTCSKCSQQVSPKMLKHDLALTMTINPERPPLTEPDVEATLELNDTFRERPQPEDPSLLIGRTFGHFEIIDTLGAGGMGQVYRALDKSLQRYVAVKVLRSGIGSTNMSSSSSGSEVDALLQEAVSQARVTHPNIVTIYYVGKEEGDPFLAMELVQGQPLSNLISSNTLTFSHIAPIALQLANALNFSYELDIIHGDIKPSNILVQPNGLTKISDFGMARRASDKSDGRLGGTPNYIAPELLTGSRASIQSDMYALGVTFYEMTFGRLPVALSGTTIRDWIDSHEGTEVVFPTPWPENYPEAWRDLLVKLLAKNPEDRFASYDELVAVLNDLKPGSKVIARSLPRMIAAAIDWAIMGLMIAPTGIILGIAHSTLSEGFWGQTLIHFADLLPIAILGIFLAIVFFWRQSPGRYLVHLSVVNQYGLRPPGKVMVAREFMRDLVIWVACCSAFLDSFNTSWVGVMVAIAGLVVFIYWLLDTAFMMFYDQGRSLHDLIFNTRVVLDTR